MVLDFDISILLSGIPPWKIEYQEHLPAEVLVAAGAGGDGHLLLHQQGG